MLRILLVNTDSPAMGSLNRKKGQASRTPKSSCDPRRKVKSMHNRSLRHVGAITRRKTEKHVLCQEVQAELITRRSDRPGRMCGTIMPAKIPNIDGETLVELHVVAYDEDSPRPKHGELY
ncbi:hypothetical protein TNCV_1649401 [Trichonephila clavipes]|nr:hypothetical protein TNCV_1649401 [Trichonephila clavipes]